MSGAFVSQEEWLLYTCLPPEHDFVTAELNIHVVTPGGIYLVNDQHC